MKTFRLEGENSVQGEVRITANRPSINATQVTGVYFDGQKWMAHADFLLDVSNGLADEFWIEAPKSSKEPFAIDPPATVKIVEIPGEIRQLIVQPNSAVRGEYRFSIGGALEIEPGQSPAAPIFACKKRKKIRAGLFCRGNLKICRRIGKRAVSPGRIARLACRSDGRERQFRL